MGRHISSDIISIHALREEGDAWQQVRFASFEISIHALREEGDWVPPGKMPATKSFLSTPSVRRATQSAIGGSTDALFLSTPSVRRATGMPWFSRWGQ